MNKPFSIITAATAVIMLGVAGATAGELPSYDFTGFPITPHQMSVLGSSGDIQERSGAPMLTRDDMPALPHQIAVLSHRPRTAEQQTSLQPSQIGTVPRPE
jgi:hypothetical protein